MVPPQLIQPETAAGMLVVVFLIVFALVLVLLFLFQAQKQAHNCFKELKRQNQILELQAQSIGEMNQWLRYFNDRLGNKAKTPPPKSQSSTKKPTPISSYKKTI